MAGRPSKFTKAVADSICEQIAQGRSLRSICQSKTMPSMATVMNWLAINDVFLEQYARAREAQADALFDEIIDIADNSDNESVQVAKLRIDARKWMAGKLKPKKYGDSSRIDHTSSDGSMSPPDATEAANRIAGLLALAEKRKRDAGEAD